MPTTTTTKTKRKAPSPSPSSRQPTNPSKKNKTSSLPSSASSSSAATTNALPNPPPTLPLGKALASTSKKTRDLAIRSLSTFLSTPRPAPLTPTDLAKLWKALFYCFWMSDKPLVQQQLADRMSDLCLCFPAEAARDHRQGDGDGDGDGVGGALSGGVREGLAFWQAFWTAMVAEWSGIDKHRVDKFLLLLRRFLNAGFRVVAKQGWRAEAVEALVDVLRSGDGPLNVNNSRVPTSITHHVIDIYLEELEKAVTWAQEESSSDKIDDGEDDEDENVHLVPVTLLLSPLLKAATLAPSKVTYEKIMDSVVVPFLDDTVRAAAHLDDDDDDDEDADQDAGPVEADEHLNDPEATAAVPPPHSDSDSDGDGSSAADESSDDDMVRYPMLLALAEPVDPSPTAEDDEEEGDEEDATGPLSLRRAVYRLLFEYASSQEANQSRRRAVYAFWREEQDRVGALG